MCSVILYSVSVRAIIISSAFFSCLHVCNTVLTFVLLHLVCSSDWPMPFYSLANVDILSNVIWYLYIYIYIQREREKEIIKLKKYKISQLFLLITGKWLLIVVSILHVYSSKSGRNDYTAETNSGQKYYAPTLERLKRL